MFCCPSLCYAMGNIDKLQFNKNKPIFTHNQLNLFIFYNVPNPTCNSTTVTLTSSLLHYYPRYESCNITHKPENVFAILENVCRIKVVRFSFLGIAKTQSSMLNVRRWGVDTLSGGCHHPDWVSFTPVSHTNDALAGKATVSVSIKTAANCLIKKHQRQCTFLFDEKFSPSIPSVLSKYQLLPPLCGDEVLGWGRVWELRRAGRYCDRQFILRVCRRNWKALMSILIIAVENHEVFFPVF